MTIELHGIEFRGFHGVLEHERQEGQRFLVDLDLELAELTAAETDRIEDAVDYRDVVATVVEVSEGRAYHLLEALASALADALLGRFPLGRVRSPRAEARRRARPAGRPRRRGRGARRGLPAVTVTGSAVRDPSERQITLARPGGPIGGRPLGERARQGLVISVFEPQLGEKPLAKMRLERSDRDPAVACPIEPVEGIAAPEHSADRRQPVPERGREPAAVSASATSARAASPVRSRATSRASAVETARSAPPRSATSVRGRSGGATSPCAAVYVRSWPGESSGVRVSHDRDVHQEGKRVVQRLPPEAEPLECRRPARCHQQVGGGEVVCG